MRTIKFRAWDKEKKQMFEVFSIEAFPKFTMYELRDSLEEKHYAEVSEEDAELMQFTGLLDKNGKEIYEGDILRAWGGMSGESKIFAVEYTNKSAYQNSYAGYNILCDIWFSGDRSEIIGNIYEHPELLK